MESVIKCEHPVIIVNPNLALHVRRGYNLIVTPNGNHRVCEDDIRCKLVTNKTSYRYQEYLNSDVLHIFLGYMLKDEYKDNALYSFLPTFISAHDRQNHYADVYQRHYKKYYSVYNISVNDLDNYYIINEKDKKVEPLFYAVPCGRCVLCKQHSAGVVSARNELEFASSSCVPYMVTLTFDDAHYPEDLSRQNQTHILQKFFKRLRRSMEYRGLRTDFRYFAVSEFGSKFHRFHYHIIFYNVDTHLNYTAWDKDLKRTTSEFYKTLVSVWRFGFIDCRSIDVTKGNTPIRYLCKYLRKQVDGQETNSWKSKYLGMQTILKYKDNILTAFKDETFLIENSWTGGMVAIPMYSFIKRSVSPTITRALPLNVRQDLYLQYYTFNKLRNDSKFKRYEVFKQRYTKYLCLCVRLGYCDDDDKTCLHSMPFETTALKTDDYQTLFNTLVDTYERLDSLHLDVTRICNDDKFFVENVVITNVLHDISQETYLAKSKFDSYLSSEIDGQ